MLRDNLAGLIEPRLSSAEAHNLGGHPKRDKLGDALGQPSWPPSLLSDPSAKFSAANPGNRQKNKWPGLKVTTQANDSRAVRNAQHQSHRTIDPRCLENPRPEGAESTLTKNAASPFSAEPRHYLKRCQIIASLQRRRRTGGTCEVDCHPHCGLSVCSPATSPRTFADHKGTCHFASLW